MKAQMKNRLIPLALVAILTLALGLRVHTVLNTEVNVPLRADAGEYFLYAYNLNHFETFSKSATGYAHNKQPEPDAYRTPGYPLFLTLFVDGKVTEKMLAQILLSQALLSTLVVYLTFLFSRKILSEPKSLMVALLTAISPHLINVNTYILTESLFSFLVVFFFWILSRMKLTFNLKVFFLLGLILGLASLVRPVIQYFAILMCFLSLFTYGIRKGGQASAVILIGYLLVFGPWMARNVSTLGVVADDTVKYYNIKFGLYPGLMYQDNPKTYGYPYKYDPRVSEVKPELGSVLQEVKRRFTSEPVRHLKWYLYEKGIMYWSWHMVVGAGEHLIFPVATSPYFHNPLFITTSEVMKILHWPLVILGLIGTILIWIPRLNKEYSEEQLLFIRTLSLLLIYFTAIHVLSFPLARYAIPIRPLLYAMAFVPIVPLHTWIKSRRSLNSSLAPSSSQ
jgi:4-amino-4-deoxy-L-arabinose transferase-like glycosyltransferase